MLPGPVGMEHQLGGMVLDRFMTVLVVGVVGVSTAAGVVGLKPIPRMGMEMIRATTAEIIRSL